MRRTFDDELTVRDWFAAHAPDPQEHEVGLQFAHDRAQDPYNNKGGRRSVYEIKADLRYEFADAMLKARQKQKS